VRIILNQEEKAEILALLDEISARFQSAEQPEFLAESTILAHELPRRVRRALNEFRLFEPAASICVVSGYPIDEERIGPTPAHWKERQRHCHPVREEMLLVMLGSLLGDVIAWSTQQDGAVVHDIAPIQGHEQEQLGSGSNEELTWHMEDAFHPFRGDYLGMLCLRNPDRVPTTFAAIDVAELDDETLTLLFEPHYTIRPDNSHLPKNRVDPTDTDPDLAAAQEKIEEMVASPEKIPVLFGSRQAPYCRLDPYFMDPPEDAAAREALDRLIRLVDNRLHDVALDAGEFCFIDNYRGVHGRRPFQARYDGTDRWLKRINITRDLRRSRSARSAPESRLLL
jgi:Fe(II)/alpha-ketoglutarate-dependent arginine beta-hydroxylase